MGSMDRYICIHGHFYQPPRENAWLEFVELQDSAYPFHDWNERITAECYAPNGMSRILDGFQNIEKIANNYARISSTSVQRCWRGWPTTSPKAIRQSSTPTKKA